tara:strand:+ start:1360 stop:2130 length:771 start_codon:yes stop_codon:yes gene_type:complete
MIRVSISQLVEQAKRLNEDKRGNIMRLLGLDREIADWLHGLNPKWSFFLGRMYKAIIEYYIDFGDPMDYAKLVAHSNVKKITEFLTEYPNEFKNVKHLDHMDVVDYVGKVRSRSSIKDNTILKFDDGFFWYDTKSNHCEAWIKKKMQHCGADSSGHLQVLFDDKMEPHATLTWNKEGNTITQLKGKQNKAPDEKYLKYVVKFIFEKGVKFGGELARWASGYLERNPEAANNPDFRALAIEPEGLQENKRNIRLIIS